MRRKKFNLGNISYRMPTFSLDRFFSEGLDAQMAYRRVSPEQRRLKAKWMKRKKCILELWGA